FRETFNGNGRTCGTCHPAENNFTIDPKFIATLPPNDPLFVAEFTPALAQHFEKPELMRKVGLILENLDGFDDLPNKFVMRGVPHITNLLGRSSKPSRFSRIRPTLRISSGFSKCCASAGVNSATKSGSLGGRVAMNFGSMVKLFSAG